jgi:tRNA pseudouridine synthase 10
MNTDVGPGPELLGAARGLLATGPLCDACLGRPFADRSFGLRNDERGGALRVTVALDDDVDFEPGAGADCWVCEGITSRYDDLADRAVEALADTEFFTYQVGTRVPPLVEANDELLREGADLPADAGEELRSEVNREVGRRIGAETGSEVDFDRPDVQLLIDLDADEVGIQRNSVSVFGRYRKLERGIPQTYWEKYGTSVEALVAPTLVSAHRGTEGVFHGAGREDVDALMLGTGRPFVLEIEDPRRRDLDLGELEAEINDLREGRVEVEGLRYATHEMIERVKELDAGKTYRIDVTFDEPVGEGALADAIEQLSGATVRQRTPERVSHRRADLVRERTVYSMTGEPREPDRAELEVHGEGGLYMKELVSGDGGRTEPSLSGLLGVGATVTHLDVVAVEGEAERFDHPDYIREVRDGSSGSAG